MQNDQRNFQSTGRFKNEAEPVEPTADEMIEESIIEEDIVSLKDLKQ